MRLTEFYGIADPVPFLDVNVEHDSALFLDPRSIRLAAGPHPHAATARDQLDSFFDTITSCVLSTDATIHARGLELLQNFSEPWETRLGLSARGCLGHGGADEVGRWIWETLNTNADAFFRIGVLRQVEDISTFVTGVAEDITSDLTTRIVYDSLAGFTADMMDRYPQLARRTQRAPRRAWDGSGGWVEHDIELPVANGRPVLLVPRDWARNSLMMGSRRYYSRAILDYFQQQQTIQVSGHRFQPSKEVLRRRDATAYSRPLVLDTTVTAAHHGQDLMKQFKALIDAEYTPLTNDMLDRKTR